MPWTFTSITLPTAGQAWIMVAPPDPTRVSLHFTADQNEEAIVMPFDSQPDIGISLQGFRAARTPKVTFRDFAILVQLAWWGRSQALTTPTIGVYQVQYKPICSGATDERCK